MRSFCTATIVEKRPETRDSVILTLDVPPDRKADFTYHQGQHVPVKATIDGRTVRRTYSICASAGDDTLRLGVRVQEDGVFSNFIAEALDVGDTLDIMPPAGRFQTPLDAKHRKTYAAFVAGSGITPLFSIIKTTLEAEPKSRFVVFYGNRMRATTMLVEHLWALKNSYQDRLAMHFIMSQEESEIPLYNGRLDAEKARALHAAFLQNARPDEIFLCGPNPMIDELASALIALGYDEDRIHSERFRPGLKGEAAPQPKRMAASQQGVSVTVLMDGQKQTFRMTAEHASLLDAAHANDVELPYSCKGGVCSTCRSLLTQGEVDMAANYALEPWELEKGYILTCQSSPKTEQIELDFDRT